MKGDGSGARAGGALASGRGAYCALLVLALAARGVAASRKSLVLDEFHTWFHATRPDSAAFLETLRLDNHPPLGFAVVALARSLLGSSELALRSPAVAFGLLELGLVAWVGSRVLGRRAGLAALALLALSSLHVDFSSQARMYALHALGATTALFAVHALLSREQASPRAALALGAALVTMFHTHYFGVHYALGLGLAAGLLALLDPRLRPRLRRLVAPVAIACAACLPWAWWGLRHQLAHALPPGGKGHGFADLAEAFVHLFFLNVRLGGELLRLAFIAAGGLAVALGVAGSLALWRDGARRLLGALLSMSAFVVPALAWLIALVAPRSGFTWHYVLPSAASLALLAAAGAFLPGLPALALRRSAFGLVLLLAALLTALNLATRGTEDFRGAVAHLLAAQRPGDGVISVEWQPAFFPQGQPYDYYAPRLTAAPPARLEMGAFTLARPDGLDGKERVLVLRKSLPDNQHLMQLLRERFELVSERPFGFGLDVLVWERR